MQTAGKYCWFGIIIIRVPYERRDYKKKNQIPAKGYEIENFKYDTKNEYFTCPNGNIFKKKPKRNAVKIT